MQIHHTLKFTLPILALAMLAAPLGPPPDDGDGDDGNNQPDIAGLIARLGGAENAARQLWSENFNYRQKNNTLKAQVKELTAKVPEGGVVLSKEDAAQWEKFKALGKTPEDLTKTLTEAELATAKLADIAKAEAAQAVAKASGYNPEVLAKLSAMSGVTLASETVQINGQPQVFNYAVAADGTKTELGKFAQDNWQQFEASLKAGAQQNQPNQPAQQNQPGQPGQQMTWPSPGAAGGTTQNAPPDLAAAFAGILGADSKPNPLQAAFGISPQTGQPAPPAK